MNKLLSSKCIYRGHVVNLYLDEIECDGVKCEREVIRHRGGVTVLAEKDGKFAFVRQYRHPMGEEIVELPAGTRNPGEKPEVTALRELEEECGLIAEKLYYLGRFAVSPGYTDEIIYFYYANEFKNGNVHLDDDEFLTSGWIDINRAYEMADNGEIYDAKTLVALYKYRAGLIAAAKK